jgi:hypothetical protein
MPGIIQRTILERIERDGYLIIGDLPELRRDSVARAATELFKAGKIESWTIHVDNRKEKYCGRPRTKWVSLYVKTGLTDDEVDEIRKGNNLFCHEILKDKPNRQIQRNS